MSPFKTVAKINLFLNVLEKGADGYHQLDSLFVPVHSLYDELTIKPSEYMQINSSCLKVSQNETNLCWQAVQRFNDVAGKSTLWSINLQKNIPIGGGLGGGSSNCAGVLNYLNQYYDFPLDEQELCNLAKMIGADVPFFLHSKATIVGGIGEKLKFIDLPKLHFVLILPNFPIATKWAYDNFELEKNKSTLSSQDILLSLSLGEKIHCHNSLARVILAKFPLMTIISDEMKKLGLVGQISGSGSSLFSLCQSEKEAVIAVEKLKKNKLLTGVTFLVFYS